MSRDAAAEAQRVYRFERSRRRRQAIGQYRGLALKWNSHVRPAPSQPTRLRNRLAKPAALHLDGRVLDFSLEKPR